ncbi:MAG: PEP-CTERM sorting domain-containing protein [Luteolibacter sp.]
MKKLISSVTTCLLVASAAPFASATTIINDDFSTNTANTTNARLRVLHTANNWVKGTSSLWTVNTVTGVLTNPGTTAGDPAEGGLLRVFDVAAASLADFTQLTFSFDYTVGTGSTLFFHAIGLYNGTTTGSAQLHNFTQNGNIQSQYDNGAPDGDYTGMNLKNGAASPSGAGTGAWSFAAGTSGTFTQTIDLSLPAYAGITDINDFQYITMGWASDVTDNTGAGAITIDNFKFTGVVPEPTTPAMILGGLGMLALIRRRSA